MSTPAVRPRLVVLTGVALLALWALSFGLSSLALGAAGLPIALGIAVAKALLVLLFFMELSEASTSVRLTLLTAIALVSLLILLVLGDVLLR